MNNLNNMSNASNLNIISLPHTRVHFRLKTSDMIDMKGLLLQSRYYYSHR